MWGKKKRRNEKVDSLIGRHTTIHAAGARITGNIHYSMMEVAVGAQVNGKLLRMREEEDVSGLEAQDKEFSLESEAKGK